MVFSLYFIPAIRLSACSLADWKLEGISLPDRFTSVRRLLTTVHITSISGILGWGRRFRGLPHGLHQSVLRDAGVVIAAAVCRSASAGKRQRRADLRFCQCRQQLLYRRGFPFGGSFQDVNALHTGIRSQCKPGFVHSRHGGNAQIDPGLSGRGDHPRPPMVASAFPSRNSVLTVLYSVSPGISFTNFRW